MMALHHGGRLIVVLSNRISVDAVISRPPFTAAICAAQVLTPLQGARTVVSMYPWIPDKLSIMNAIAERERDAEPRLAVC